jgi:putative transposase
MAGTINCGQRIELPLSSNAILLPVNTHVHGEDIVHYLRRLRSQLRGPMALLWDGSRVHDCSGAARVFLAEHSDIKTERLPAYAPELNPDELVWAWTK